MVLSRPFIRWMIRRDLSDVLRIEDQSFAYAWTEDDFLRCLRQTNCIGMVAECNGRVVGYMIYELRADKIHLLNFAVDPTYRRSGVGSALIVKLLGKLSGHRRRRLTLAVRERNLPAHLFFRANGLRATGVLPHYYEDSGEDAIWFEHVVAPDDEPLFVTPSNRIGLYDEA